MASKRLILLSTAIALFAANLFSNSYLDFSNYLQPFVNHFLIAIFFFVIGQELRDELHPTLALPAFAALGGMIFPAAIYRLLNNGSGWMAAMPTDLALVLIAVSILGKSVRREVRIFLLALALSDDLLSILFISIKNGFALSAVLPTLGAAALGLIVGKRINLQPISDLLVVPLFILVNFGFQFIAPDQSAWALALARVSGKTIGIFLFTLLALKLGAKTSISLREIAGVGALAGMGLTVSLYLVNTTQIKIGLAIAILISYLLALIFFKNPMAKKANS